MYKNVGGGEGSSLLFRVFPRLCRKVLHLLHRPQIRQFIWRKVMYQEPNEQRTKLAFKRLLLWEPLCYRVPWQPAYLPAPHGPICSFSHCQHNGFITFFPQQGMRRTSFCLISFPPSYLLNHFPFSQGLSGSVCIMGLMGFSSSCFQAAPDLD